MQVLTEQKLRQIIKSSAYQSQRSITLPADVLLTPSAKSFINERNIVIRINEETIEGAEELDDISIKNSNKRFFKLYYQKLKLNIIQCQRKYWSEAIFVESLNELLVSLDKVYQVSSGKVEFRELTEDITYFYESNKEDIGFEDLNIPLDYKAPEWYLDLLGLQNEIEIVGLNFQDSRAELIEHWLLDTVKLLILKLIRMR
ncbi:hypothetical protein CL176_08815 [Suicoccus acidiformans]|uniref:Uncharacterized protein n=1 Tax=Suicoccus acidiformans TaxID=2036206 RepID=A0A347WLY6_9LACT|nr:hypothetical protein [Suicoccus acidiformans]AXY26093.1 hypothetical protein CL176_08815 [Suicoccus acidiformans]